ncbi:DUF3373 family protein [Sulfuricurvum sp.]|uniref:DUF3373 family protein n=1 Tax=Sulfuricurvum sp. TaxID=2025608 RepID=UPI003BB7CA45
MMIKHLSLAAALTIGTITHADEAALQKQIEMLMKRIEQLEKAQGTIVQTQTVLQESQTSIKEEQTAQSDLLSKVNAQSSNDNIKWDIDFRSGVHSIDYKGVSGIESNTLMTNRLWLGMGSKATENLFFYGQLAVYNYWGVQPEDITWNDDNWRASSRPHDVDLRLRQAYFVYKFGNDWDVPMTFSTGRRAATDGFLANHREGNKKPGSPLAHITNMEVDAAMVQFDFDKVFLPGSYLKVVYGRSNDSINTSTYLNDSTTDGTVDFIVFPMSIYNDGASNLMAQYAKITNVKGEPDSLGNLRSAGTAHLGAISYQLDGLSEENEFLENSTLFASAGVSSTHPNRGINMLGSLEDKTGYSLWAGFLFPDQITDGGRFGLEYNWGSKYWTPMTWAEDSMTGSKIATRGSVYEGYWNIPIVGKNLTAQLRYTYLDHQYRANSSYMMDPDTQNLDNSQELRAFVRYQY